MTESKKQLKINKIKATENTNKNKQTIKINSSKINNSYWVEGQAEKVGSKSRFMFTAIQAGCCKNCTAANHQGYRYQIKSNI